MFLSLLFPARFFAASIQSISVNTTPSTIDQSQEFEVNITLLCPNCSDSYLRAVFYPSGSSYFGYTQSNSGSLTNVSGGSCTSYLKISQSDLTTEGTWSGKLKAKPDTENAYYKGPGEYLFKVGRYTSSCGSPLWSLETTIAIAGPTPTPTLIPTSIPTNTPVPTNTPIPTNTPTPKLTPTPTPKITQKSTASVSPKITSSVKDVLGESSQGETQVPDSKEVKILSSNTSNWIPVVLILIGIVFLIACAIVFFYPYIIRFKNKKKDE